MGEKELILDLGSEGGRSTVYRSKLPSDGWQYHVEGNSVSMDEQFNEDWSYWESEPCQTLQGALDLIEKDAPWISYYPMKIHPEYRQVVWELTQEIAANFTDDRKKWWKTAILYWQSICLERQ